jgi:hypothetical protein
MKKIIYILLCIGIPFGSVASVKKILFYANDCEPIKNKFIENQGFMILNCPGFD